MYAPDPPVGVPPEAFGLMVLFAGGASPGHIDIEEAAAVPSKISIAPEVSSLTVTVI